MIINKLIFADVTNFQITINDLPYQIIGGYFGLNFNWELKSLDYLILALNGITDFGFYGDDMLTLSYLPETTEILRVNTLFLGDQTMAETVEVFAIKELYLNTFHLNEADDYQLLEPYQALKKLTIVDRFYVKDYHLFINLINYCRNRSFELQINEIQGCQVCYQYYVENYLLTKAAR